jgi:hypothetical protein
MCTSSITFSVEVLRESDFANSPLGSDDAGMLAGQSPIELGLDGPEDGYYTRLSKSAHDSLVSAGRLARKCARLQHRRTTNRVWKKEQRST